jgi:uncharacterized protein YgfB (UPF0149 family)
VATQPDYDDFQNLLHDAHALAEPAEAHGTLAGALCAAPGYRFEDWLAEILPEGVSPGAAASRLAQLFDETRSALLEAQLDLQLLIPDDEQPLGERTEALALWCNGFLYGLAPTARATRPTCPVTPAKYCAISPRSVAPASMMPMARRPTRKR